MTFICTVNLNVGKVENKQTFLWSKIILFVANIALGNMPLVKISICTKFWSHLSNAAGNYIFKQVFD